MADSVNTKPDDRDSANAPPQTISRPDRASPTDAAEGNALIQQPAPNIPPPNAADVPGKNDNTPAPSIARPDVDTSSPPSTIVSPGKIDMPQSLRPVGSAIDSTPSPANANSPNTPSIPFPLGARGPNGETVFSDGSGGPNAIPRTISADQLQRLNAASAAPSNPYFGPEGGLSSALMGAGGLGGAPEVGSPQSIALTRPNPAPPVSAGSYDPIEAARSYASDLASIASKDPRSVLGTAAWNNYVDAKSDLADAKLTHRPQAISDAAAAMRTINRPLVDAAGAMFNASNTAGGANARDQTQFADTQTNNAANITRARYETNARLVGAEARADAMRYGADQRAGSTIFAANARGNAQRDAAQINANRPRTNAAFEHGSAMAYANGYNQAIQNGLSPDQAIGYAQKNRAAFEQRNKQQDDEPSSKPPQEEIPETDWSPSSAVRATQDATNQSALRSRQQIAQMQAQAQQQLQQPTAAHIQLLQQDPRLADFFDAKFGRGAAAQYLRDQ